VPGEVRFDFTGRVALVTGGASGMGAAVAAIFADAGASVVIVDLNADAATRRAEALGDRVLAIPGDVTDAAFCEHAVATTVARFGGLHAVVNAAGIIVRKTGLDTTDDDWLRVMAVNASGVFFMSRAAARHLAGAGGGAVVNFGSIWGELGGKGAFAYCASKGAVHQLTRAFALELGRDGVRFNCVCPGEVDTPMLRAAGRAVPMTDAEAVELGERVVPMGRLAQPDEIARVAVFLCSDSASYVTGAMYYVDGAYAAM